MGYKIALQLIKTTDKQKLFKALQSFYATKNIELKEEDLGQNFSILPLGNQKFSGLNAYLQDLDEMAKQDLQFTTNFFHLERKSPSLSALGREAHKYSILLYNFGIGQQSLFGHPDISTYLSGELMTEVIDFLQYDVVGWVELRRTINGVLVDEVLAENEEVFAYPSGYFKSLIPEAPLSYQMIDNFFESLGIDTNELLYIDLKDEEYAVTPVYLSGAPEALTKLMT